MSGPQLLELSHSSNSASPLHATKRDPSRRTDGTQVALIADLLGTPLMPWQQLAADIALQREPDGRYTHQIVVISVPRQSGKTTLLRAIAVQKMMSQRGREIYYTAQTGKDARARWDDLVEKIESNPGASDMFSVRKSAGSAAILHKRNRSKFLPFAPTAESLHGYTPHDVMIDEAFSLNDLEGKMLMGAIVPAQSTIADRQLYIVSTKGTAESTFLNDWIERGRAGEPGVAIVEYAAGPGVDAYDPESWPTFHPAHGLTIFDDTLHQAGKSLSRSEYERAYANRTTTTASTLIPVELWEPLASSEKVTAGDAVAVSYDVAHDLTSATVVLSWVDRSTRFAGQLHHRILERHAGTEWLLESIRRHVDQVGPDVIAADDGGPARGFTAELVRQGLDVKTTNGSEIGTAYGRWITKVRNGRLTHDGTEAFATAAGSLVTRPVGDSVAPSRRHSPGDISPLIAAVAAGWQLEQLAPAESSPLIAF